MIHKTINHLENQLKPWDDDFIISDKAGYILMNKSTIDEDAGSEVLKILKLEKTSMKINDPVDPEYENFEKEKKAKRNRSFHYATYFQSFYNS